MLTVRVLPRRGTALRSAAATVEVTGVLVAGHVWAGGSLPSAPWVALMAGAVFGAGLLVLRGRVRVRHAVPALAVVQLLMHAWLTLLTPMPAMDGMSGQGHLHAVLDAPMLGVHLAGALVTALVWELRSRAVDVLVTWTTPAALIVLPAPRRPRPVVRRPRLAGRLVATSAPRRGPPSALAPA